MINELMRVGDEVTITVPPHNRMWGHNPCPDGTRAVILGFSETHNGRLNGSGYKPGVYVNRERANVRLPDGREYFEWSGWLELTDKDEYERRLAAFRKLQQEQPDNWCKREFLRGLPETPFWEGDFVRVFRPHSVLDRYFPTPPFPDVCQIVKIDYHNLSKRSARGSKVAAYWISGKLGDEWQMGASEDWMRLIERGPVWKFFHDEPVSFESLEQEALFFELLGHTEEVRNPANNLSKWTKEEMLEALKRGFIHSFSADECCSRTDRALRDAIRGTLVLGPEVVDNRCMWCSTEFQIRAKRFRSEDLGLRVAQATLEKFGLALN